MKYSAVFGQEIFESEYSIRCNDIIERELVIAIDKSFLEIMKSKNVDFSKAIMFYGSDVVMLIRNKFEELVDEYFQNKITLMYCWSMQKAISSDDLKTNEKTIIAYHYSIALAVTYETSISPIVFSKIISHIEYT